MARIKLTQGYEALVDDEDLPRVLRHSWRIRKNRRQRYAVMSTRRGGPRTVLLHRFIMEPPSGLEVDHINGDGLDNRRANLRICTRPQNCANTGKRANSISEYRGVTWSRKIKRWTVSCQGRYVGCFTDERKAALAYNAAATRAYGDFARLNEIKEAS